MERCVIANINGKTQSSGCCLMINHDLLTSYNLITHSLPHQQKKILIIPNIFLIIISEQSCSATSILTILPILECIITPKSFFLSIDIIFCLNLLCPWGSHSTLSHFQYMAFYFCIKFHFPCFSPFIYYIVYVIP